MRSLTLIFLFAFARLSVAGFMVGEIRSYSCEGLYCYGGWSAPACAVLDQSGKNVIQTKLLKSTSLVGYTRFEDKEVVVSYVSDCLGDQSYKECLVVSTLDNSCNPGMTKRFLIESGDDLFYENYRVTSFGEKLLISMDVNTSSEGFKETLVLELDPQLSIIRRISFPSSMGRLVGMSGKWLVFKNSEGYSILDISRGMLFDKAVDLPSRYYLSKAYTTDDGELVLFFSSPSGFSGTFETYILAYREDGSTLKEIKSVYLDFLEYSPSGFPYFEKAGRCGSRWEMMIGLWEDFGGKIHHMVATASEDFENFKFYSIKGSKYRAWPVFGDKEGFYLDDSPSLVDDRGCTYLAFGVDNSISAVSLEALPLEIQKEGIKVAALELDTSFNGTSFTMQEDNLVEIRECGEECLEARWTEEPLDIGVVKDPTWFYLIEGYDEGSVVGRFFCYGPPGYKVYCGVVLNNDVWIYDSKSGFVKFQADRMDEYNPFYDIDTPTSIFSISLCSETGAELPKLNIWLFAAAVPENESLSSSLEKGDILFTMVPWETPDCR